MVVKFVKNLNNSTQKLCWPISKIEKNISWQNGQNLVLIMDFLIDGQISSLCPDQPEALPLTKHSKSLYFKKIPF